MLCAALLPPYTLERRLARLVFVGLAGAWLGKALFAASRCPNGCGLYGGHAAQILVSTWPPVSFSDQPSFLLPPDTWRAWPVFVDVAIAWVGHGAVALSRTF